MERLDTVENTATDSQENNRNSALFKCIVRLEVKGCDFFCDGTGFGGDSRIMQQEKDPTKKLELLGYAKKLAHRYAFENAFKRVIIVSLENGKVGVEINQQDIPDCSLDELGEDGVVKVNCIEEVLYSDTDDEDEEKPVL